MNIAVLGSGTIGQSWCALFLAAGHRVVAYDPDPAAEERIIAFVDASRPALESLGYQFAGSTEQFRFSRSAIGAVEDAQFIQENAPEKTKLKHQLFSEIEPHLEPEAVILSSTSGITLEELQAGLSDAGRIVIAHPFNPPHLIPLIELLGNDKTDPLVMKRVLTFYESLGKVLLNSRKVCPDILLTAFKRLFGRKLYIWRRRGWLRYQISIKQLPMALEFGGQYTGQINYFL